MRKMHFACALCALAVLALVAPAFAVPSPSNAFPDPFGYYQSTNTAFYVIPSPPGLVTLESLYLDSATGSIPPPLAPASSVWSGSFLADTKMSFFGGPTVTNLNNLTASDIRITGTSDAPDFHTYDTEMLFLSLTGLPGNPLGPPAMIRESPTLASTGGHTIAPDGGGGFYISSFFDVFTELSLDGGDTWIPATGPVHLINPEPSTVALLVLCSPIILRRRRRAA